MGAIPSVRLMAATREYSEMRVKGKFGKSQGGCGQFTILMPILGFLGFGSLSPEP